MSAESNTDLVHRYFEVSFNKGDTSVIDEMFAADYLHHDPANPDSIGGVDDVRHHISTLRGAFPDIVFSVEDLVAEDSRIAVRWSATLTHTGDYFGIPPTMKSAVVTGINTWYFTDGKAVEGWVNRDDLGLMQQLGLAPSP
jgi:steroid delta-isomerase-like uncharacterized protein